MAGSALSDGTFRAHVGDRSFDLRFEDGTLYVDDAPVDYAFDRVDDGYYALRVDGQSLPVVVEPQPNGSVRITAAGRRTDVRVQDEQALLLERFGLDSGAGAAERELHAPMPGLVLTILVEPGQAVQAGDGLIVLEAMKMENELRAQHDAVVAEVHVEPGEAVGKNALLLTFEAE